MHVLSEIRECPHILLQSMCLRITAYIGFVQHQNKRDSRRAYSRKTDMALRAHRDKYCPLRN